jgi:hypothetical protein
MLNSLVSAIAYLAIFPVVLFCKLTLVVIRVALALLMLILPFVGVSLIVLAIVCIIAPLVDTHNTIANVFKENSKVS